MDRKNSRLTTPVAILIGCLIISISILISGGIIKIGPTTVNTGVKSSPIPAPAAKQPSQPASSKVSVDDDPVLGSKDAKVTLIEFSDYECPFCKRHFDQVYPSLKKDYIDSGKVKMVFRDYPLPFHDPMASFEAGAASCAREQGGDGTYFKFHDAIFTKTKSNGNGLTKEEVYQIASDLGLNQANLKTCADSAKYAEEIKKDMADGSSVGVSGTPTFFIGKSDPSDVISGQILVGAQPYTSFQAVIDPLLQ